MNGVRCVNSLLTLVTPYHLLFVLPLPGNFLISVTSLLQKKSGTYLLVCQYQRLIVSVPLSLGWDDYIPSARGLFMINKDSPLFYVRLLPWSVLISLPSIWSRNSVNSTISPNCSCFAILLWYNMLAWASKAYAMIFLNVSSNYYPFSPPILQLSI